MVMDLRMCLKSIARLLFCVHYDFNYVTERTKMQEEGGREEGRKKGRNTSNVPQY